MTTQLPNEERKFVEEVGIVFEQTGLPRMAGRIFGRLMICDPPYQSPSQLVDALIASRGSISTMTRLLVQLGIIERFCLPGERQTYLQISVNAWKHLTGHGLADEITLFRELADHGLEILADKKHVTRRWLEEMRDIYAFLEKEFPALWRRWEQEQKAKTGQYQ
ncbi:MAG TPA: MarR family transcriptional regulator [Dehalococcoidia bacterium]|nr:MarR family transcriptional regulator [Dehalococcoidia bacterium]